jgi:hypothetical protein
MVILLVICLQVGFAGKEKKRKDYAFRRQFNEKPSIIPGCPEVGFAAYNLHLGNGLH